MTFLEPPMKADETAEDPTRLLKSGTAQQFEDLATALNMRESMRSRLLLRAAPLDVDVLHAAQRFPEEQLASLLLWLQAATNQPPGQDFLRHFSKLPPFVTRCLALPCTTTQRAALRCVLQLARCPALRVQLGEALPRLLELLEVEELRGAAAGALCNVACEATVRPKARVAVPVLLSALPSAGNEAEDMVAALGVLAKDADAASMDSMVDPLLACLPQDLLTQSQGGIGLTLEVLSDLVRASGFGGSVCFKLAKDARLVSALVLIFEHFSASSLAAACMPCQPRASKRPQRESVALSSALRLCVLLQDLPAFSATFRNSRGLEALRSVQKTLDLENPGSGGGGKARKFCQIRCEDLSCADCPPKAPQTPQRAPTKQEIVQQLLNVLAV